MPSKLSFNFVNNVVVHGGLDGIPPWYLYFFNKIKV
jgi:hypothetical protein